MFSLVKCYCLSKNNKFGLSHSTIQFSDWHHQSFDVDDCGGGGNGNGNDIQFTYNGCL